MNPSPGREEGVAYAGFWTRCGEFAGRRVFRPSRASHFLYEKPSVEMPGFFQSDHSKLRQLVQKAPFRDPIRVRRPFRNESAARRPRDLPNCKRRVCPGERCGPPLADNRARSIGWLEIRQLQRIEWNGPLASVFRFRLRWLLTVAPRRPSKSQKNP